ncbi:MAG: LGFP repeat-containing protein [Caulobacteraceae bacterium]
MFAKRLWAEVRRTLVSIAAAALAGGAFEAAPNSAGAQPAGGGQACGHALGGAIFERWNAEGGEGGPLGCPTAPEQPTSTSPQGSKAREATFAAASLLSHASGPHAGQTFLVSGCFYRLYFQYGGASGWLGLPVSDAVNTPDGQRQKFEGGAMTFLRAPNECSAERASPTLAVAPPGTGMETSPLDQFRDAARGDYAAIASAAGAARAKAAHYQRLRTEAYVFTQPFAGSLPLKAYWNAALGAHRTVATAEGERDALAAGYVFDGAQGFVYADPTPGTRALKQFRDAAGHGLLTGTPEGEAEAAAQGFVFVRIEGYAPTAPGPLPAH